MSYDAYYLSIGLSDGDFSCGVRARSRSSTVVATTAQQPTGNGFLIIYLIF